MCGCVRVGVGAFACMSLYFGICVAMSNVGMGVWAVWVCDGVFCFTFCGCFCVCICVGCFVYCVLYVCTWVYVCVCVCVFAKLQRRLIGVDRFTADQFVPM